MTRASIDLRQSIITALVARRVEWVRPADLARALRTDLDELCDEFAEMEIERLIAVREGADGIWVSLTEAARVAHSRVANGEPAQPDTVDRQRTEAPQTRSIPLRRADAPHQGRAPGSPPLARRVQKLHSARSS